MLLCVINLSSDLDCCWLITWCQRRRGLSFSASLHRSSFEGFPRGVAQVILSIVCFVFVSLFPWSQPLLVVQPSVHNGKDTPIFDASSSDRGRALKFFVANFRDFCVTEDYINPAKPFDSEEYWIAANVPKLWALFVALSHKRNGTFSLLLSTRKRRGGQTKSCAMATSNDVPWLWQTWVLAASLQGFFCEVCIWWGPELVQHSSVRLILHTWGMSSLIYT